MFGRRGIFSVWKWKHSVCFFMNRFLLFGGSFDLRFGFSLACCDGKPRLFSDLDQRKGHVNGIADGGGS